MGSAKQSSGLLRRTWHSMRRHVRLTACGALALVLSVLFIALGLSPGMSVLLAFDIAVVVFLAAVLWMFVRAQKGDMEKYAREEGENYWSFLLISVVVAGVALLALAVQLQGSDSGGIFQVALAAGSQMLVWLFINTVFTLHYAHEFYDEGPKRRWGLDFPATEEPDYWDFVYFAFCLGMTFQVSDVEITERGIRRVATVHSLVAFLFNVVIVALSVNVVAGIM